MSLISLKLFSLPNSKLLMLLLILLQVSKLCSIKSFNFIVPVKVLALDKSKTSHLFNANGTLDSFDTM
jgi:hypothetical protein